MSAMRKYGEVYHYKAPAEAPQAGELWIMAVTDKQAILVGAVTPSGSLYDWVADIGDVTNTWTWSVFHSLDTCYFTCP